MEAGQGLRVEAAAEWLRKHFDAEASRGFSAVVRLELTGEEGGVLALRFDDGTLRVSRGEPGAPDLRIRLDGADFLAVLAGRANGELLHMQGRVRIEGVPGLAMKLQALFRRRV